MNTCHNGAPRSALSIRMLCMPVASLAACLCIGSIGHASESTTIPGRPKKEALLWPKQELTAQNSPASAALVSLGERSAALRLVATNTLGRGYPCAAVALTSFAPPHTGRSQPYLVLNGVPTPKTTNLLASSVDPQLINESLQTVTLPWDLDTPLSVHISIDTRRVTPETAVSTILCEIVDHYGYRLQAVERPIQFVWDIQKLSLVGIYEAAVRSETDSTVHTK